MGYYEKKEDYEKKYNEELRKTGVFFAFSNEQFETGKTPKNAPDNEFLSCLGGIGAYIHKSNIEKLKNFLSITSPKLQEDFKKQITIDEYIKYELSNHECYYTYDYYYILPLVQDMFKEKTEDELKTLIKSIFYKEVEKSDIQPNCFG